MLSSELLVIFRLRPRDGPARPLGGPNMTPRTAFGSSWASWEAPNRHKDDLKRPQEAPRWPQDGPKTVPRGPKILQEAPRWAQKTPRWPQHGLKDRFGQLLGLWGGPKSCPRRIQIYVRGDRDGKTHTCGNSFLASTGCQF